MFAKSGLRCAKTDSGLENVAIQMFCAVRRLLQIPHHSPPLVSGLDSATTNDLLLDLADPLSNLIPQFPRPH